MWRVKLKGNVIITWQTGSKINAGAPNREMNMMQHTGQVVAMIRKDWHQLEKDNCACVKYRHEREC